MTEQKSDSVDLLELSTKVRNVSQQSQTSTNKRLDTSTQSLSQLKARVKQGKKRHDITPPVSERQKLFRRFRQTGLKTKKKNFRCLLDDR